MPRSTLSVLLVSALLLLSASASQAQTQASCTFTFLPTMVTIPNFGTATWSASGINDFGTVVGSASTPTADFGIIRWAGGGVTPVFGTSLVARNDSGLSIGYSVIENNQPILLIGTSGTDITLNGSPGPIQAVNGINGWGSVVGTYFTDFPNGLTGFKRWSNGGFITLNFPGAQQTTPIGINDSSTIVGSYFAVAGQGNGFIYHNGQWASLNFPSSTNTTLTGISNAGVIIGNAMVNGSSTAFLYGNGVFKVISVPNALANSTTVFGIGPKLGMILGTASFSTGDQGFIATCQ